jgi:cytochrome c oxidase subunit II
MRLCRSAALFGVATLALAACGDDRQDIFTPEGDKAEQINRLQVPVFITAGVVGVLVFVALGVAIAQGIKRRKEDSDEPVQLEGNFRIEILWTIAPALLLAVIAVFTVATLFELDDAEAAAPEIADMEITVYGQQWWWAYEYDLDPAEDDGPEIITANDLVIPIGTDVTLNIEARDVIHSYWVPALNGTRDAVPGRTHSLVLQADEPGVFDGQCKEYCGLSHANMKNRVVALTLEDFLTWTEQQQQTQPMLAEGDPGFEGQQLFIQRCSSCHQINGLETDDGEPIEVEGNAAVVALHAPNLTHLMTRGVFAGALFELYDETTGEYNRDQLEAWIRNPPAEKPMYVPEEGTPRGMPDLGLTEPEIDAIVDYLETLHPDGADGPPLQTNSGTDE